jgi:hypothetical protein
VSKSRTPALTRFCVEQEINGDGVQRGASPLNANAVYPTSSPLNTLHCAASDLNTFHRPVSPLDTGYSGGGGGGAAGRVGSSMALNTLDPAVLNTLDSAATTPTHGHSPLMPQHPHVFLQSYSSVPDGGGGRSRAGIGAGVVESSSQLSQGNPFGPGVRERLEVASTISIPVTSMPAATSNSTLNNPFKTESPSISGFVESSTNPFDHD